jgi:hypothetical protein
MVYWTAVKNILKYLKRTKKMYLVFGGDEELIVKGYTNASFVTHPDDFKSIRLCFHTQLWCSEFEKFQAKQCGGFYNGGGVCRGFRSGKGGLLD